MIVKWQKNLILRLKKVDWVWGIEHGTSRMASSDRNHLTKQTFRPRSILKKVNLRHRQCEKKTFQQSFPIVISANDWIASTYIDCDVSNDDGGRRWRLISLELPPKNQHRFHQFKADSQSFNTELTPPYEGLVRMHWPRGQWSKPLAFLGTIDEKWWLGNNHDDPYPPTELLGRHWVQSADYRFFLQFKLISLDCCCLGNSNNSGNSHYNVIHLNIMIDIDIVCCIVNYR